MNKRDEVEQQVFEDRQSTMKKGDKSESRFKFKFESLKKLPSNSAIRAFFRSFEPKHHNTNEQPSSTEQPITTDIPSSPINEDKSTLNPKDMIVHRVIYNDQDDNKVTLNYFQQKYKQILKPSLLFPKQYYNEILNKRNLNYSTIINRHDLCLRSPATALNLNSSYSNRIYPPTNSKIPLIRPPVYREINASNDDQNHIIPPSASSILIWNQCVRRLNTEYRLTINALQQAKECLEQVYLKPTNSVSKYANLVARGINDLSNNEPKKASNVTFCLPSIIPERSPPTNRILSPVSFSKPKLVTPVQLNTFIPFAKLEPVPTAVEQDEKIDSISNIIKKFNDLSNSSSSPQINRNQSVLINEQNQSEKNLEEETTYTVETLYTSTDNNENDLLSNNRQLVIIREDTTEEQFNLVHENEHEEIEINPISLLNDTSSSSTTPIIHPNNNNESSTTSTPLKNNNKSISHIPKRITTTNVSRLKQPTKIITSSTKLKPPSSTSVNSTTTSIRLTNGKSQQQSSSTVRKLPSINESQNKTDPTSNHVKSIVHQLNTTTTSSRPITSSSITNKRTCRPLSTNKNIVQRK